jgi:3-phosphoshikimate 1-carboxyvinyltransferase
MTNFAVEINLPPNKSQLIRSLALSYISGLKQPIENNWPNDAKIMHMACYNNSEAKNFEDAGTPLRFMAALLSYNGAGSVLNGYHSLQNRPLKPLLLCLESLGAQFQYLDKPYCIPFRIVKTINPYSECFINGNDSSQFVSAILLLACTQKTDVKINYTINGSYAYLKQTIDIIRSTGIEVLEAPNEMTVKNADKELSIPLNIEGDFSSFAFVLNLAAKTGKNYQVKGLWQHSNQADRRLLDIYAQLGFNINFSQGICYFNHVANGIRNITVDIKECIDLGPALMAICSFLNIELTLTGWEKLEQKESNRVLAMQTNLKTLGIIVLKEENKLLVKGRWNHVNPHIVSFNDHRVLMAMSLFSQSYPVSTDNANCVNKSFPNYWEEFKKILEY